MITNTKNISLNMAVFLAQNDYDAVKDENYISVTSLLKPIRAIILGMRVPTTNPDVLDFVASRIGTAIHTASENSWLNGNHVINMRKLGYPENIINRVKINPNVTNELDIPVYLERRSIKSIAGYKLGGKFDIVIEGSIRDIKTVKAFSYMKNDTKDYQLQMSIYRWLNLDIIKGTFGFIDMLITDWKQFEAIAKPDVYPQLPIMEKKIPLLSYSETEDWLNTRLNAITALTPLDQSQLPLCSQEDLWQDDTTYAYFKKPDAKRATKIFTNLAEANQRLLDDGSIGKIVTRYGVAKRCNYCSGREICSQAKKLEEENLL